MRDVNADLNSRLHQIWGAQEVRDGNAVLQESLSVWWVLARLEDVPRGVSACILA